MKTIVKWLNNSVVLSVLLVLALITCLVSLGQWYELSKSDWGGWVGSIGTVCTLVGTIMLATSQTRRLNRQAAHVARLHAASMTLRIAHVRTAVDDVVQKLRKASQFDHQSIFFIACESRLAELTLWQVDELVPLVPLPNQIALKLGEAADQIQTARRKLREIAELATVMSATRRRAAEDLYPLLEGTSRFLQDAIAVCRASSVAQHLQTV